MSFPRPATANGVDQPANFLGIVIFTLPGSRSGGTQIQPDPDHGLPFRQPRQTR